ncbi:hypothetical protein LCGC14_0538620 [marine sediment metagenome]|uniref:Rubredoxin-like domain-containing protein n=1 Tax=marine sediment metagenome TaxID=412755 RepID=A0A0F9SBY9_9ZZZZ
MAKHITKKTGECYQMFCGKTLIFETDDHTYQLPDGWVCPVCNLGIKQIMQELRAECQDCGTMTMQEIK